MFLYLCYLQFLKLNKMNTENNSQKLPTLTCKYCGHENILTEDEVYTKSEIICEKCGEVNWISPEQKPEERK